MLTGKPTRLLEAQIRRALLLDGRVHGDGDAGFERCAAEVGFVDAVGDGYQLAPDRGESGQNLIN
jgi:hypothetical protein